MKKLLLFTLFVVLFYVTAFSQNGLEGFDVLLSPQETKSISYDALARIWQINGYKISLDSMMPPQSHDWRFITILMLLRGENVNRLMNDSLMHVFRVEKLAGVGRDLYGLYVSPEWDDGFMFLIPQDFKKPVLIKRLKFNGVINPDK